MNIEWFKRILKECDLLVVKLISRQENIKSHKWYGGVKDEYGIHNLGDTTALIRSAACSFMMPKSKFYRNDMIIEKAELAMRYLLESQCEDGTADFYHTNFHSTPDLAFALERLCAVYDIFEKINRQKSKGLKKGLKEYILKGGEALIKGGIHTANHRWVVCMALAWVNHLFPDQRYVDRIDEWLSEGVDIDSNGQFSEKSAAIYSPLCCRCFLTMARLLDRPELYEYTRRNLDMTMYLMHPNGEVDTMTSRRQDKDIFSNMGAYYLPYRFMAIKDVNPLYSAMAWRILDTAHDFLLPSYLVFYLSDPLMRNDMPSPQPLPLVYEKHFKDSHCARIRDNDTSVTIASCQPGIISVHKKHAILRKIRLASAFFGKGQFEGDKIEKLGNQYVLKQQLRGLYYQPLPKEYQVENGNWDKMDHTKRTESELCELSSTVSVEEKNKIFKVNIKVEGTDNVPVVVEMGFNKGGKLVGVEKINGMDNAYLLVEDYGKYIYAGDIIEFGPGHVEHTWTQLRGALPKMDADSVYLTGITPFNITIEIK
jgi:hypothetical protein